MRILVTGHLGYIGTVLVPHLIDAGHEVIGLDNDLYAACTFGPDTRVRRVPTVGRDLRDVTADDLGGIDAVVHLAALSNDPLGDLDRALTLDINHRASIRLATAARDAGVRRFVFSSSCSNYGAADGALLDETAEVHPVTAYGESKVLTEHDLEPLDADDFAVTSLRNATAYGDSPRLRTDIVLNNLIGWAMTTGRIHLKSDGSPWRPLVHVRDIARAVLVALEADPALVRGRVFNVGSTRENHQIRGVADVVQRLLPDCAIEFSPSASPDARNYRVDCDLFSSTTGFATEWTIERGAQELKDAYERYGFAAPDVEGPRFQRIAQIRSRLAAGTLTSDLRSV